ncbi:PEP/pyruvate-binding domain-containing protein [Dactylosporangium roseum]
MMIDLGTEIADPDRYGWKAHYLSLLAKEGYTVPEAWALAPDQAVDMDELDLDLPYAVRSSGLAEDAQSGSYAGHFSTHLDVRGAGNVRSAIDAVRASAAGEMRMGVVVQRMVESPVLSGVGFSCHPLTLDRHTATVSYVRGLGGGLVSGTQAGHDVEVRMPDGVVVAGEWPVATEALGRITDALVHLDDLLGQPVDIEWCLTRSGELVLLQLRPVVLPEPMVQDLDSPEAFAGLPSMIAAHSKLALRADAIRLGVPMSTARAVLATCHRDLPTLPPLAAGDRSAGRSVVLLHPTHLEGKVVREFAQDCSTDVEFFVRGCQRYAIRQYPHQAGSARSVAHTLHRGLERGAIACVIEQEILHAYATGIIRGMAGTYLVEVALGHFVPKGNVATSTFVLSHDLRITHHSYARQSKAYHFINGHVVVESPPYEPLEMADADLRRLVQVLRPVLAARPGAALEFGLLGQPGSLQPYMIDVADGDRDADPMSTADVARGVVSSGLAAGPVIDLRESRTRDDLNTHLYDAAIEGAASTLNPSIYIARQASVDLLPIVRACHPASGFIFEQASVLAHLPVILRERGVAAITMSESSIDALVRRGGPLAIDTGERQMVMPLEESSA